MFLKRSLYFQSKLEQDHLECQISQTINGTSLLLLDSGSELNLIKLSSLNDQTIVYENVVYHLKGINNQLVPTIGQTQLHLKFGNRTILTDFQVVHSEFPIQHDGILGKPFMVSNRVVINYETNEITIPDNNDIILQPRTETLVAVRAETRLEEEEVLIACQELSDSIMCSNVVSKIKNRNALISLINPTEQVVRFCVPNLEQLNYEEYRESSIHTTQTEHPAEPQADSSRLIRLAESLRMTHLNSEEKASLTSICNEYSDLFFLEGDKVSATSAVTHEIRTSGAIPPIHVKPYRLPQRHRQEITEQMEALEREGVIVPSDSPWNAPLLVVPKKPDVNGKIKYRVCVDFRRLNEVTIGDAFPLPNIVDILDQLGRSKYYSTLDLAQGYHQVPMNASDREKTAFSTDRGHYEFLRMPFGLKGAPGTFQRLMNQVLVGLNGIKAFVYLDDIIVYAKDLNDHSQKLSEIFNRLRRYNLKLQPLKCEFLRKEVAYLGHVITDEGVKPDPQKVECVKSFPVPKNVREIKSFLGLSGYYRRFINNYGQIAKPLTTLLKKDVPFRWSDLCQESFENLKNLLTKSPILQYPDFTKPFNLTCDASNYAVGCVLSQGPIGKDLPIAYASRTLNKAEINYNTTEKELTSIVWGIKVFRPYLFGQQFNIITDHRALVWLFNLKDPGSRLTRWRLKLEEYQYTIHFKSGVSNTNADALSRIHRVTTRAKKLDEVQYPDTSDHQRNAEPLEDQESLTPLNDSENTSEYQQFLQAKLEHIGPTSNVVEKSGDLFDTLPDMTLAHCVSEDLAMKKGIALEFRRKFGNVKELKSQNRKVTEIAMIQVEQRRLLYIITKNSFWQKPNYETLFDSLQNLKIFCIENSIDKLACPRLGCGLDGLKWDIVRNMLRFIFHSSPVHIIVYTRDELREEDKLLIIKEHHENPLGGHQGISRTYNKVSEQHHWQGMRSQIREYIKRCRECQINKTPNQTIREPMVITTTATKPFEKIFMDIVGPLPTSYSGNTYILTLIDDFSKFSWASAMKDHEANTVSQHFVTQFVCLHGQPKSLVTDCGTEFLSKVFKEVCQLLKISKTSTTPYHPQSNGSLERSHRTLGEYLRNYASKEPQNWDVYVPYYMYCHNSSIHSATGFQPHEIVYGYPLVVPTSFSRKPEPQYNYQDYQYEMKRLMQESHQMVRDQLVKSKEKSKDRYDKKVNSLELKIGDKVIIQDKTSKSKLASKWHGPYPIIEISAESPNVTILKRNKPTKLHRNLLRLFQE